MKESMQITSEESQAAALGKRTFRDLSNTDRCSTTFTQNSKHMKKRDMKANTKVLSQPSATNSTKQ